MRLAKTEPWLRNLLADQNPPCVSIYLPVHRAEPSHSDNNLQFRELVDQARSSLARGYPEKLVEELVAKLQSVTAPPDFWTGNRDGIAVFASRDILQVIDLQYAPDPVAIVNDTFYLKPLLRVMQSAWRYHVLTFTQRHVVMYEGIGEMRLERLDSSRLPQSADIVSGMRMSHEVSAAADLETAANQFPGEGTYAAPASLEQFMRAVDKAVWENYSRDSELPLILCAIEHNHPLFHGISKNKHLLKEGIRHDPQQLPLERIRHEAWAIMEPRFRAAVEEIKNRFLAAKAHQKGSDELVPVIEAATAGRIDTLLVDGGRDIVGRLDRDSGQLYPADARDPRAGDVLEDLAGMVLRTDGDVIVLTSDQMPGDAGLAAIYRY